ncbi:MAG: 2OG-Fe(II) oxygenase family protein [Acidimicrobiales bacterium]
MELGVVDLSAPMPDQVRAMRRACESLGFIRLPVNVIDRDVAAEAWATTAEFFALPEPVKREIEFPEPGYPYGYSPYRYETLARSLDDATSRPDMKESLSVGPDCGSAPASATDEEWIRSPSLWPSALPGLRPAWTAYYRALADVAASLMSLMAQALDLPPDHFDAMIDRPISSMRGIHYPAAEATDGALRAGAHADYGTLTILRTDDVPGLQIRAVDGTWLDVAPDPDMFVVNLGDSISQWTNGRWPSTVHRVVPSTMPRQSMAFFHMANWDATIEALPGCVEAGEAPRHPPVQAGPWLMKKFRSTVVGDGAA